MDREYVENRLLQTGIPSSLSGFDYIIDYIMISERDDWKDAKITAIYMKVAKMNRSTFSAVERGIRYAFEIGEKVMDAEDFEYYFGISRVNSRTLDHFKRVIKRDFPKYIEGQCKSTIQDADSIYEDALNALNAFGEKLIRIGDIISKRNLLLEQ